MCKQTKIDLQSFENFNEFIILLLVEGGGWKGKYCKIRKCVICNISGNL